MRVVLLDGAAGSALALAVRVICPLSIISDRLSQSERRDLPA